MKSFIVEALSQEHSMENNLLGFGIDFSIVMMLMKLKQQKKNTKQNNLKILENCLIFEYFFFKRENVESSISK